MQTLLPIYLLYAISAALTSQCNYSVLDAQALRFNSAQAVEAVKTRAPDVLISWVSLPSLNDDIKVLNQIKKTVPDTWVVVLGAVPSVIPEEILLKSSVDLIIKGRYPHQKLISNLINTLRQNPIDQSAFDKIGALYIKDGKITQKSNGVCIEDLDQLSLDAYYQLPLQRYLLSIPDAMGTMIKYIPLLISIGCPYSCMYCPYPIGYGRTIMHKSVEHIVDEIAFVKTKFNINGFLFRDQLFTHNKERVLSLCDEIIARKLDIKWFVEARVDETSEELLQKMKKAGCFRIHYGVETGNPEMLKKEGKPGLQIETVKKVFTATREHGVAAAALMIVGLPGESEDTITNSLDLLREIKPDNAFINVITPYPGTKLFEISKEQGWISTYDWSKYTGYTAVMGTGKLSTAQLDSSARNCMREFRNFKLVSDRNYRKFFVNSRARELYSRIKLFLKS